MQGAGGNPGVGGVGVEKYRHGEGRNTCKECEEIKARSGKKYRQGEGRNTRK